jgi:signal transduction histidine kinase
MHFISPTLIPNFFRYVVPDLNKYILLFNIFPYIVFVSLVFLLISIYKYNAIDTHYKFHTHYINHSINEASLGIKTMTHSIKNHILAIQNEAHFLAEKYSADEDAATSLRLITESCSHAFESINKASEHLKVIHVDLRIQSCYDPIELMLKRLTSSSVASKLVVHIGTPVPTAYLDIYYFSEALYNIVDNAFDAIKQKPDGYVHLSLNQVEHFAVISISDNGCGMSEEALSSLFTPFHSTKSSLSNWGVGLSYCHKIIDAHAGAIHVESKLGIGTTFEIMIPTTSHGQKETALWEKKL